MASQTLHAFLEIKSEQRAFDEYRAGQTKKDGSVQMIPFTHKLLAQYVGTSREVITLFMNRFRREGYLNYSRKGNIVIHRDALAEWLRESPAAQEGGPQTAAMAG